MNETRKKKLMTVLSLTEADKKALKEIAWSNRRTMTDQVRFWISIDKITMAIDKPLVQAGEGK